MSPRILVTVSRTWTDISTRQREPGPEEVAQLADLVNGFLTGATSGLWRIVPARPDDDEAAWYIHRARSKGPGVFEGVEFRWPDDLKRRSSW